MFPVSLRSPSTISPAANKYSSQNVLILHLELSFYRTPQMFVSISFYDIDDIITHKDDQNPLLKNQWFKET